MTCKHFCFIRKKLHFVKPDFKDDDDHLGKVRPLYRCIKEYCNSNPIPVNITNDEQMIPFLGWINILQYLKDKPNPWGIKNFIMAGIDGYVYDFIIYQGKKQN